MVKTAYVTRTQILAAQLAVKRAIERGRPVPPAVQMIADARRPVAADRRS